MNKDLLPKSSSTETPSNNRISPDIVQFITIDDLVVRQAMAVKIAEEQLKLERSKVPIGMKHFIVSLSDTTTEIPLSQPWLSFSISNESDSAGKVYCVINEQEGPLSNNAPIGRGESVSWKFDYPIIEKIFLEAESGLTATVKIFGEVGKWQ